MIGEIATTLLLSPKSPITIDDLELFGNLSFTHHVRILNGEKEVAKRWKYIKLALENKWDTRFLQQQIKENIADHYGVMPSNFGVTIKDSRDAIKALSMFKGEYLLDFINTEEICYLYKKVKDPNLVGSLSSHSEVSRAFARYRDIDESMKKELVGLLE
jgi:hypothetical protein